MYYPKVLILALGITDILLVCKEMKAARVVPDVIDQCPKQKVEVQYAKTLVTVGDELTPSESSQKPTVDFSTDPYSLYTLCIIDPDAPSRMNPKFKEWLHWLVVNVPGNSINRGSTIAEYQGPTPPRGSGKHRYIILGFKQLGYISENEVQKAIAESLSTRMHFNIRLFARHFKLGDPVAVNFFYSQEN